VLLSPLVYLVGDDHPELRAIARRLEMAGFTVQSFASPMRFSTIERSDRPSCLVIDLQAPELGEPQVQQRLAARPDSMPIVFLTDAGSAAAAAWPVKAAAIDFLAKPVAGEALVEAVRRALQADLDTRRARGEITRTRALYSTLTTRQREVFALVARGSLNKEAAAVLGMSERTVKAHRAQIMMKMRAASFADLVLAAERLGMHPDSRRD
jgi:FixJ family two-component response regulator